MGGELRAPEAELAMGWAGLGLGTPAEGGPHRAALFGAARIRLAAESRRAMSGTGSARP